MIIVCPQCKHNIMHNATKCIFCGFDEKMFFNILNIKKELIDTQKVISSANTKLDILNKNLDIMTKEFIQDEATTKSTIKQIDSNQISEQDKTSQQLDNNVFITNLEKKAKECIISEESDNLSNSMERHQKIIIKKNLIEEEIDFGQKWLLIIGIAILVMGIGYFLKYSFSQNWVSSEFKVIIVYSSGLSLLGIGDYFRKKEIKTFGLYLISAGLTTFYFATFAAFDSYSILGQIPAFFIIIVTTILCGMLSLFYNTKWLAIIGITGGFLTPMILDTNKDTQIILMSYIIILNFGVIWLSSYKQWGLLNKFSFIFTWILFSGWFNIHYTQEKFFLTIFFLHILFFMHETVPFVYFFTKKTKKAKGLFLTILNTFIAFTFSYFMIKELYGLKYVSIVTLFYSFCFLLMASLIYKKNKENKEAIILLISKALLFFIITIPIIFSEHIITIFWIIQSYVLLYASLKIKNHKLLKTIFILYLLVLGKFFIYDYIYIFQLHLPYIWDFSLKTLYFKEGYAFLFQERLMTTLTVLISQILFFITCHYYKKNSIIYLSKKKNDLIILLSISVFIICNIEISGYFNSAYPSAHFAAISTYWSICSIILIIIGFYYNNHLSRKIGIFLFFITMFKLFLIDISKTSVPFRIISFLVLGILFILASFLYYKYKDNLKFEKNV